MNTKTIVGVLMIAAGCYLFTATQVYNKTEYRDQITYQSDTASNIGKRAAVGAAIGAGTGAAAGGVLAACVGGVGVVACGTGIGIPVGAALLGLTALFGGAGAAVGAATGETTTTITPVITKIPILVQTTGHAFHPLIGISFIALGALTLARIGYQHWKNHRNHQLS